MRGDAHVPDEARTEAGDALATRVADSLKRGAKLQACEVTMGRQKLTMQDMLPDIGYVKAGLGQIVKRQKEGWSYISG